MGSDENASDAVDDDSTDTGDSREQGVDIGPLADELENHSYPTTTDELLAEYGDYEIDMSDESHSLREILSRREGEDEEYQSADQVRQMIYNLVGDEAVGRSDYTDRGGTAGDDREKESL